MPKTCQPRIFAGSCAVGLAVLVAPDLNLSSLVGALWHSVFSGVSENEGSAIHVYVVNREGRLVGPVKVPRWKLTDMEWKDRLTPEQFAVLRAKGTENSFCGTLLNNKQSGLYCCVGCGLPLFASDSKYDSDTGWPSFFQPVAATNIEVIPNFSMRATGEEIRCTRCSGHLGHVFQDGPAPTGVRYCLNSAALVFTRTEDMTTLADSAAEAMSIPAIAAEVLESSHADE